MSLTPSELLARARARAEANPGHLIQGQMASDKTGASVNVLSEKAICHCAIGLIAAEAGINVVGTATRKAVANALNVPRYVINEAVIKNDSVANQKKNERAEGCDLPLAGLNAFDFLARYVK